VTSRGVDEGLASQPPAGGVATTGGAAVDNLGARLRDVRHQSGMSLREVARQLGVSPSFVSQMENGKSQPSVSTLYAMAQLLNVSIDELFDRGVVAAALPEVPPQIVDPLHVPSDAPDDGHVINRSDFTSPAEAWPHEGFDQRCRIVRQEDRPRLVMASGVAWEQLASNSDRNLDFMEITYPPGASSTNDGRMLRHQGMEYGYLLSGKLVITHGFDQFTLLPGESMWLDPAVPHLLTNPGHVLARGIWAVHHCALGPVDA
jgi:transcriptional regulator with XRE-family HTH domain